MKTILKFIVLLRKFYWKIFKPVSIGARAILINSDKEFLLVKHNYSSQWYLPGGKIGKGEGLVKGLERELTKEVGMGRYSLDRLLGTYLNRYESKNDYISVFVISDFEIKATKHFEIDNICFYSYDNLPNGISPGTRKRIEEYLDKKKIDYNW